MHAQRELLRELAALKRYGKNGHPTRSEHIVTINVPSELLERIDALLAQPEPTPYAYEVTDSLGDLELIYAQAATAEDIERPHAPLYR
ncbi:hypothetical protein SAMN05445504_2420 [Burkholderia sp. CF099]|nr:hypothetical protein SAMN05445504_2420 [Burkholderia sp. CF099]